MNNFLKVSLLAAAVAVSLTACQKDEKPAANNAEVKAEASKPAEAPKADAKSFEEQSGYAIGLSMGVISPIPWNVSRNSASNWTTASSSRV